MSRFSNGPKAKNGSGVLYRLRRISLFVRQAGFAQIIDKSN
jgi:hypothetical protein